MTTIANALIRNEGTFEAFRFINEGETFAVLVKQTKGECRTGRVAIYIKAGKTAAERIGFYCDDRKVADLIEYVKDELLCEGVC